MDFLTFPPDSAHLLLILRDRSSFRYFKSVPQGHVTNIYPKCFPPYNEVLEEGFFNLLGGSHISVKSPVSNVNKKEYKSFQKFRE